MDLCARRRWQDVSEDETFLCQAFTVCDEGVYIAIDSKIDHLTLETLELKESIQGNRSTEISACSLFVFNGKLFFVEPWTNKIYFVALSGLSKGGFEYMNAEKPDLLLNNQYGALTGLQPLASLQEKGLGDYSHTFLGTSYHRLYSYVLDESRMCLKKVGQFGKFVYLDSQGLHANFVFDPRSQELYVCYADQDHIAVLNAKGQQIRKLSRLSSTSSSVSRIISEYKKKRAEKINTTNSIQDTEKKKEKEPSPGPKLPTSLKAPSAITLIDGYLAVGVASGLLVMTTNGTIIAYFEHEYPNASLRYTALCSHRNSLYALAGICGLVDVFSCC
jgi:hypothetical protein